MSPDWPRDTGYRDSQEIQGNKGRNVINLAKMPNALVWRCKRKFEPDLSCQGGFLKVSFPTNDLSMFKLTIEKHFERYSSLIHIFPSSLFR